MTDVVDFQDLLTNQLQPEIIDNVVLPEMQELYTMFAENTNYTEGNEISDPNCIAETAAGGAFTRSDSDPESMTVTWEKPAWTKVYYHEAAKIRGEDVAEARGNRIRLTNLFTDAAFRATRQLMNTHVFSNAIRIADLVAFGVVSVFGEHRIQFLHLWQNHIVDDLRLELIG